MGCRFPPAGRLSRCQLDVLLEDVRFQVGLILNSQLMEQLCTQLHLLESAAFCKKVCTSSALPFASKSALAAYSAQIPSSPAPVLPVPPTARCEGAFLAVQQGSGVVKPLLLGCLLLIGQANGKFHVVLWWNDIVFGSVQLGGLQAEAW